MDETTPRGGEAVNVPPLSPPLIPAHDTAFHPAISIDFFLSVRPPQMTSTQHRRYRIYSALAQAVLLWGAREVEPRDI